MSDYIKTDKVLDLLAGVVAEIIKMPPEHTEERTETHGDLISRKAAIDAMGERPLVWDEWVDEYELGQLDQYDSDKLAIETVSSAEPEPRWIPVSERLPEIGKEVLLSEPNAMFIAEYHGSGNSEGLWLVDGCHHYLADVNGCAWMPLPEAYRGESDVE